MDWLQEHTVHRGMVVMSIRKANFTDLDFADDAALLVEMLSVLVLVLEVMNEEAQPLGLTINWAKTKIQTTNIIVPSGTTVQVGGSNVEVVDTFTNFTDQVEASMKLLDAFPSPATVCRCWTRTLGGPWSYWVPNFGSTMRIYFQYFCMEPRRGP